METIRFAADTIIRSGHMRMYTPSSAVNSPEVCKLDTEFFIENKGCSNLIREAGPNEFENGFDAAYKLKLAHIYAELPKLWVLVFGDESLYFSVPVYRGKQFFPVVSTRGLMVASTVNDRATRLILAEMDSLGGIETEAFEKWRTKWLTAIAKLNQKALAQNKSVN